MAYFSIINFFGGVESGLIWLKTGGFLKFYSGNTARIQETRQTTVDIRDMAACEALERPSEMIGNYWQVQVRRL